MIGLCVTFGGFPCRFSKCCFHSFILSCWFVAFSLALAVVFLLLTSFIVCQAILDCLSSTESLILSIWFCMYSICSFRYMLANSFCAFLVSGNLCLLSFSYCLYRQFSRKHVFPTYVLFACIFLLLLGVRWRNSHICHSGKSFCLFLKCIEFVS